MPVLNSINDKNISPYIRFKPYNDTLINMKTVFQLYFVKKQSILPYQGNSIFPQDRQFCHNEHTSDSF